MKTSSYEEKVITILKKEHIKFEREKAFRDLRKGFYKFDFYIPSYNICIEVDGEQHFKQIKYFQKTRQDFLKAQERDRRKNSYCLANGIKLFRIPFWEIDNIKNFWDLTNPKFKVTSKFHNDYLKP